MDSQAEAILFGLALGDALGYPVEFLKMEDIKRTYPLNASGIMGVRLGMNAIPPEWCTRCENANGLIDLAHRMTLDQYSVKL